jgi:hypothetical protein
VRAIYACDVGSTRSKVPKFAWARISPERSSEVVGSSDIRELVTFLEHDLKSDRSVALGFEAPLFMPVPDRVEDLSRGRSGEGGRSMFAPAGSAVATLGLHQAAWILRRLFLSCGEACAFTLDWAKWPPESSRPLLFCWEAFVSQEAHSASLTEADLQDAATAAKEFLISEDDLEAANAVKTEHPLSMMGAAALWSGWASDSDVLHQPALVVKPVMPYEGPIVEPGRLPDAEL